MLLSEADLAHMRQQVKAVTVACLRHHALVPEARIASNLSLIEILVCLYYGRLLAFSPGRPLWPGRDRLIVSKGHGAVALCRILADLGFQAPAVGGGTVAAGMPEGSIPDCAIPGIETLNGALGHGLGVAAGMAMALRLQNSASRVVVLHGDGELMEGAVWEAVMWAAHHRLGNLIMIVDANKKCMLDTCARTIDLEPLEEKFRAFAWQVDRVDGHDLPGLHAAMAKAFLPASRPRVLIADTVKGRGIPALERDDRCHVRRLSQSEIERRLTELA